MTTCRVKLAEPRPVGEQPAGRPIPEHPDALLFTAEAALLLGLSPRTLEAFRLRGGGPPYIAVTPKAVRYRRRDLEDWITPRPRVSTSDPGKYTTGDRGGERVT